MVVLGETSCEPLVLSVPDQPPLLTQEVAFLLDHLSVEVLPALIVAALEVSVTVGAGGGGVTGLTVMTTEALPIPPEPEQVMT